MAQVTEVATQQALTAASFSVVRDDLAHPFLGGNKMRKLDGLWPELSQGCTDVVTCGGLQSAHTAAVAAVAAEHGKRAHLLVRGERPAVPTGHHLFARMLAHRVQYVSRPEYADRGAMMSSYVHELVAAGEVAPGSIAVIPEGAAEPGALLGLVRLGRWLAELPGLAGRRVSLVVDSGTGATAVGLALAAALLDLRWTVVGVMLAGPLPYYQQQQELLTHGFCTQHGLAEAALQQQVASSLRWVQRRVPRRFGHIKPGEVAKCRELAQQHGVVLDPIWSLAAWEVAEQLASQQPPPLQEQQLQRQEDDDRTRTVMLHTGGMLGLCGLAQRFPADF